MILWQIEICCDMQTSIKKREHEWNDLFNAKIRFIVYFSLFWCVNFVEFVSNFFQNEVSIRYNTTRYCL